ncbi:uncharacterized protein LOC109536161 isoform X1 [Dendroctonus ponderosae]|uniref:Uncharacterized protein n=1 Tax=Dendroctonus ponderosae TaxID=77166 RepID=A0AAR5PAV6_DENPD|nr:uncharacterized protein LOC109536161 isoform X1 [Dendroctonus ponderosae]KAH1004190.1 hypothetical protein HUJ04_003980 [Dendroctonus ponderosae]KAH1010734.1 hypothetical protein HUJ05_004985 [Dendroctonus ponderosae]
MSKTLRLEAMIKELGLNDNTQEKVTNDVKKLFLKKLICLKKLSVLLSAIKEKRETLMPKNALTEIISDNVCNSEEYVLINTVELDEHFQREIAEGEIDINRAILQMLRDCLLYIINLLRGELETLNVNEFFDYFNIAKTCIFTLTTTNIQPSTSENTQQLVTHWIYDLFKIITAADNIPGQKIPKDFKAINVVQQILTQLAHCHIYYDIILQTILEKLECSLTYKLKPEFSDYMATQSSVFAYLLWTLQDVINIEQRPKLTEEQIRIRTTLETLTQCLQHKFLRQIIQDILESF